VKRALMLESFDARPPPPAAAPPPAPAGDAAAVGAAFERGYKAGWDDCERQAKDSRASVGAEFARNIQDLGFTYHEARAHVLSGIEPLLATIVGKVLPSLATATLGQSVVEELKELAETAAESPVTILVAPETHDLVAEFLAETTALPYRLVADETLTGWQVFFRLGAHERQLNLGGVIDRVAARIAAFSLQNEKVLKHG